MYVFLFQIYVLKSSPHLFGNNVCILPRICAFYRGLRSFGALTCIRTLDYVMYLGIGYTKNLVTHSLMQLFSLFCRRTFYFKAPWYTGALHKRVLRECSYKDFYKGVFMLGRLTCAFLPLAERTRPPVQQLSIWVLAVLALLPRHAGRWVGCGLLIPHIGRLFRST